MNHILFLGAKPNSSSVKPVENAQHTTLTPTGSRGLEAVFTDKTHPSSLSHRCFGLFMVQNSPITA